MEIFASMYRYFVFQKYRNRAQRYSGWISSLLGLACLLILLTTYFTYLLLLTSSALLTLLCYLLTPWSRVLLEKLTGSQLVQKFPAFYETRRFITAVTRHLSLSWARSIQSIPLQSHFLTIIILSCHLRFVLQSGLFSPGVPTKTLYIPLPHTRYMPRPSYSTRFYHPNNIG